MRGDRFQSFLIPIPQRRGAWSQENPPPDRQSIPFREVSKVTADPFSLFLWASSRVRLVISTPSARNLVSVVEERIGRRALAVPIAKENIKSSIVPSTSNAPRINKEWIAAHEWVRDIPCPVRRSPEGISDSRIIRWKNCGPYDHSIRNRDHVTGVGNSILVDRMKAIRLIGNSQAPVEVVHPVR